MSDESTPHLRDILVAKVLNERTVVLNRGQAHGVKMGQRFVIYEVSEEEISDPATGDSLGHLEIVKGTGRVSHVQERLSTLASDSEAPGDRIIRRRSRSSFDVIGGWPSMYPEEEIVTPSKRVLPFRDAKIGDHARPI